MSKIKHAFLYECSIKIKAMVLFYLIQYLIVALISAIIVISTGINEIGSNILELNTVIFLSVIGVLGYKEDFKALIQNGYTRKYIFISTIYMFLFLSGTMALIDTIIGNIIHFFRNNYATLFGSLYGYHNLFVNWLFLAVLYLVFCCLFYLTILVINRVGKMVSLLIGGLLCGTILIVIALFRFVLSGETTSNVISFLVKAMGFMSDGSINYLLPILSFLVIGIVLGISSFAVIRRSELKV